MGQRVSGGGSGGGDGGRSGERSAARAADAILQPAGTARPTERPQRTSRWCGAAASLQAAAKRSRDSGGGAYVRECAARSCQSFPAPKASQARCRNVLGAVIDAGEVNGVVSSEDKPSAGRWIADCRHHALAAGSGMRPPRPEAHCAISHSPNSANDAVSIKVIKSVGVGMRPAD